MQSETEGLAAPSDAMFLATRSVDGNIDGGTYAEQGDSFAALTTDLSITTHMDALVPCRLTGW